MIQNDESEFLKEQRRLLLECENLEVKVDLESIPDEVFTAACVILNSSIRAFLATPEGKASYEAWEREGKE